MLAIVLTARVLGPEIGIARTIGAVGLSVVIGLLMAIIFRGEEKEKVALQMAMPEEEVKHSLWQKGLYFAWMIGILVFANWGKPLEATGIWASIYSQKWQIAASFAVALALILVVWYGVRVWKVVMTAILVVALTFFFPDQPLIAFTAGFIGLSAFTSLDKGEAGEWFSSSWSFS